MARDFDGANDNISFGDLPAISDLTTISCSLWVWNDAITADMNIVENSDATPFPGFRLYFDDVGSGSGRTDIYKISIRETAGAGGSELNIETATSSATEGAWQHVFWSFEAASATGLQIWINGAEDANSPRDVSTLANMGNSNGVVKLGETNAGGADRNGKIAETAFWNRVLTDTEIVILSKGYSPSFLPTGMIFYAPLIGKGAAEPDIRGGASGTLSGTTDFAHPRIIYPGSHRDRRFTTSAAGGGDGGNDWPILTGNGFRSWRYG